MGYNRDMPPVAPVPQFAMAAPTQPMYFPAPVAPVKKKDNTVKLVVGVSMLAGLGYLGWRYWYLPMKMRQILAAETQRRIQQGQSPQQAGQSALDALCAIGGSAVAAGYGVPMPPNLTGQICQMLPLQEIINVAIDAVNLGVDLGRQMGEGFAVIGTGVLDLGTDAVNVVADVGGGIVNTAQDVVTGTVDVVADVGKTAVNVVKSCFGFC